MVAAVNPSQSAPMAVREVPRTPVSGNSIRYRPFSRPDHNRETLLASRRSAGVSGHVNILGGNSSCTPAFGVKFAALQMKCSERYAAFPLFSGVRRPIMDGKVIVVTGALGALGSVVTDDALARGARIASVDHAPTQVPATADLFELGGVDLTDAAQAKKAIDAAASHFGKIDALINIAGGFTFEMVTDGDPKTWQRMYALNVMTALNASRAAIPHLVSSGTGSIVNIGAMGALQAD